MNNDKHILQLVEDDRVYWCKREGGSEAYQIHRHRLHQMVQEGLVFECQDGCCYREYYLTEHGKELLHDKG